MNKKNDGSYNVSRIEISDLFPELFVTNGMSIPVKLFMGVMRECQDY